MTLMDVLALIGSIYEWPQGGGDPVRETARINQPLRLEIDPKLVESTGQPQGPLTAKGGQGVWNGFAVRHGKNWTLPLSPDEHGCVRPRAALLPLPWYLHAEVMRVCVESGVKGLTLIQVSAHCDSFMGPAPASVSWHLLVNTAVCHLLIPFRPLVTGIDGIRRAAPEFDDTRVMVILSWLSNFAAVPGQVAYLDRLLRNDPKIGSHGWNVVIQENCISFLPPAVSS